MFGQRDLKYLAPKGLLYPLVGSFRALVVVKNKVYSWVKSPKAVWEAIGAQLVNIILDERADTPDSIAKDTNLWSNLFKEVYIYGHSM